MGACLLGLRRQKAVLALQKHNEIAGKMAVQLITEKNRTVANTP